MDWLSNRLSKRRMPRQEALLQFARGPQVSVLRPAQRPTDYRPDEVKQRLAQAWLAHRMLDERGGDGLRLPEEDPS